ncbi:MAG: calcium-binding protein [Gemmobacter sp.]
MSFTITGPNSSLQVINAGTLGLVTATGLVDNIVIFNGERATLVNRGEILNTSEAVAGSMTAAGVFAPTLVNSGAIVGVLAGVRFGAARGDGLASQPSLSARIENTGSITALGPTNLEGGAIRLFGDANTVVNTGTITALSNPALRIVSGAGNAAGNLVINTGAILGAVALDRRNDRVENTGRITGDIDLGAGNDTLDGRGGTVAGQILGGAGNDIFIVDDPRAVIVEANRQGNDTVQAWVDFVTPQHVEVLDLMGPAIRGTGNNQDNRIVGNAQDNVIAGLGGNDALFGDLGDDTITGGAGNDRIFGGEGNDAAWGGAGNDTMIGQDGDDALRGDAGNDSIDGGAGNDSLWAGSGNDSVCGGADDDALWGGAGNDALDGGEGDDSIWGGTGDDTIFGLAGEDAIYGGAGRDSIDGGADDDSLYGGNGNDTILGGEGADLIEGGAGNDDLRGGFDADTILGGAGEDIIEGGFGADLLDGGPGADRFVFRAVEESGGPGIDTIRGFQPGEDVIDLRLIDANANQAGRQPFTFIFSGLFTGTAGELRVSIEPGQRVILGDIDGDRTADFALVLDGTPIITAASFLL